MHINNFKRDNFYKFTKNQLLSQILSDNSLTIKNNIIKNFKVIDISVPNNLKNN